MNANALASALVTELRTNWRRSAVVGAGVLIALIAIYELVVTFVLTDENRPAGKQIVAAVEAFKQGNKRYPEHLAELQPRYLATIPRPAAGTNFVYAISSDGTVAWFGYQTSSGGISEYATDTRKWRDIEYDDSEALRMRTKEFVMGSR